ncbi:MAG: CBS domain-containing protein [Deltaproteobacteria bacterium]|nr:CBS domain-containing protein [Deltaproteobacteria bacterium]
MKVEDIMNTVVVTIDMDERLKKVKDIFDKNKFHHILVVENNELVGVVSDRDILKELSPFIDTGSERVQDLSTLDRPMHQIMTRRPITADKETTIEEAVNIFVKENISCLPVLSLQKEIIGIITWKDILINCLPKKGDENLT